MIPAFNCKEPISQRTEELIGRTMIRFKRKEPRRKEHNFGFWPKMTPDAKCIKAVHRRSSVVKMVGAGMSQQEVADILDVSKQTVTHDLFLARQENQLTP